MLVFAFWLLGVVLIVAQTTFLQYLPMWLVRPDFVFILVSFIAYRFAWVPGVLLVFSLGWIIDVVAGIHLGIYPLTALAVFGVLKAVTTRRLIKESTYQIPLVGFCYFLVQVFYYFIYSVMLPDELPEWSWVIALQRTALVVVSAIPLFLLFNSLYEYIQKRRLRGKAPRRRPPR
jgi:rod shape-determining protein MreD